MKNKNIFLVGIGLLLVVAVLFLIMFFVNKGNEDKFKDSYKTIETNLENNLIYLTAGYITEYDGTEKLFERKETKIKNLEEQNQLTYVIMVASQTEYFDEKSEELSETLVNRISKEEEYLLIKSETVKNSMKTLLGIDWKHKSVMGTDDFMYNFEYMEEDGVYLVTPTDNYESIREKTVIVSAIESTSTAKTVKTTVAVAYVEYSQNSEGNNMIRFYSDQMNDNLVFEVNVDALINESEDIFYSETDLMKDYIDEFNKYEITSREEDGNFILESIQRK